MFCVRNSVLVKKSMKIFFFKCGQVALYKFKKKMQLIIFGQTSVILTVVGPGQSHAKGQNVLRQEPSITAPSHQ